MTAQDNQRGRPFDFYFDQFLTKCEVRTSQENKEEGLLISLSNSSQPRAKKGLHKIIKEEGLLMLLLTSLKPNVKKGLHKKKSGRRLDFFVDHFFTKCEVRTLQEN
jgi:uncharacterized phosphosugar-binding protein